MKNIAVVFKKDFARTNKEKALQAIKRAGFVVSKHFDFVIVFGGDGTIFEAEMKKAKGKPILAINAGDLGFLAQGDHSDIKNILNEVKKGHYIVEERTKLYLSINHKKQAEALNDIFITSALPGKAIRAEIKIDTHKIASVICDGILISTPTGSTAYNTSANGSIVEPRCKVIIVNPVNPHLSTIKPMVVDDEHEIQIKIKQAEPKICAVVDGIKEVAIKPNVLISVKKSKNTAKLIKLNKSSFFDKINRYFT